MFDTAEAYGPLAHEELLGESLEPIREQVVMATKFGFDINPEGRGRGQSEIPARSTRRHILTNAALALAGALQV